jgi:hypothetical protein
MFDTKAPLTLPEIDKAKTGHLLSDTDYIHYRQGIQDWQKLGTDAKTEIDRAVSLGSQYINPSNAMILGKRTYAVIQYDQWARNSVMAYLRGGMSVQDAVAKVTAKGDLDKFKSLPPDTNDDILGDIQQNIATPENRPPLGSILK